MKSIKQIKNLKGKKILLRVDFNVPIKNGVVVDDFRIKAALPTINFLLKKGAEIILITHFGKDGTESLEPIEKHFFKISKIDKSRVTFFDNIRKFPGEMENDMAFAKKLSTSGDIYVNDAFSVSHRKHASIVALPKYLPSFAGLQMTEEVKNLSHAFTKVKHPFLFILGGAKFSTKVPLIKKYLKLADYVFVGGALANDLLKARGYEVGRSLVDDTDYGIESILKNKKLVPLEDVLVKTGESLINKKVNEIEKDDLIIDIGENSTKNLALLVEKSKFILWNGPLGKYEDGGAKSTLEILKLITKGKSESILGGGDLVSVFSSLKPTSSKPKANLFVSTGGGATLDFLANGTLPGIKVLK